METHAKGEWAQAPEGWGCWLGRNTCTLSTVPQWVLEPRRPSPSFIIGTMGKAIPLGSSSLSVAKVVVKSK